MAEPSATQGAERAKPNTCPTAKRQPSGRCGVSPLEGVGLHDEGVSPRGRLSPPTESPDSIDEKVEAILTTSTVTPGCCKSDWATTWPTHCG